MKNVFGFIIKSMNNLSFTIISTFFYLIQKSYCFMNKSCEKGVYLNNFNSKSTTL